MIVGSDAVLLEWMRGYEKRLHRIDERARRLRKTNIGKWSRAERRMCKHAIAAISKRLDRP